MRKRNRNRIIWLCAAAMTASLAAGCGQGAEETAREAEVLQGSTENLAPDARGPREDMRIFCVTEIAEQTITAEEGTFERPSPIDIPDSGNGGPGKGGADGGLGADGEGGRPGADGGPGADGEGGRPGRGGGFGRGFESSGETVTFQVTGSTEILLGSPQGNQQGTIEDIAVGSILEVRLDAQDQAEQIIINNMEAAGDLQHGGITIEETEL